MTKTSPNSIKLPHQQADLFRAALEYTQSTTGFRASLIEKDYYCSLILQYIFARQDHDLMFKGGTCLNKVHLGFFRLSEDLDFTIPTDNDTSRTWRRRAIEPVKQLVGQIAAECPYFQVSIPLTGANNSTQYNAEITYQSALSSDLGRIKIEVGLREGLLLPADQGTATTLLKDPFSDATVVPGVTVRTLSLLEALAEKARAMLTRREVAIRDFFDFWHAQKTGALIVNTEFLYLVRKKLAVAPSQPLSFKPDQIEVLETQVETDLRPVLNETSFAAFSLQDALDGAAALIEKLAVRIDAEVGGIKCIGLNKVGYPGNLVAISVEGNRGAGWSLLGEWPEPIGGSSA